MFTESLSISKNAYIFFKCERDEEEVCRRNEEIQAAKGVIRDGRLVSWIGGGWWVALGNKKLKRN